MVLRAKTPTFVSTSRGKSFGPTSSVLSREGQPTFNDSKDRDSSSINFVKFVTTGLAVALLAGVSAGILRSTISAGASAPRIWRVSLSSTGQEVNNGALKPSINSDGRYVAFHSQSTNLGVSQNPNTSDFIFVHDNFTGVTEHVTVDSSGNKANLGSGGASINADGRFVAVHS